MTEQPGPGAQSGGAVSAVEPESVGPAPEESPLGHAAALAHESFHGRPVSWIAVAITIIGFLIGGLAFASPPTWWLVYTGGGIALLGFIVAGVARVNEDWY
ncbi:MAG TPA: hypothetical protein VE864_02675 [Streptosporangiaceae bacterium]|nr:hypothetical protein [Streptosporangiaceae bacterium]